MCSLLFGGNISYLILLIDRSSCGHLEESVSHDLIRPLYLNLLIGYYGYTDTGTGYGFMVFSFTEFWEYGLWDRAIIVNVFYYYWWPSYLTIFYYLTIRMNMRTHLIMWQCGAC